MDNRDKILEFIKRNGPVLPSQISKEIGTDILMASAHLAELTASGKLKISALKIGGGSPLYFLQGQESMLNKYTTSLNDKELKAFNLLSEQKILKDSEQAPVIRVALREIRDFALPINVKFNDKSEMFWKWHLAKDEEVEGLIRQKLELSKPIEKKNIQDNLQKVKEEFQEINLHEEKGEVQEKIIQEVKGEKPKLKDSKEKKPSRAEKPKEKKEDEFLKDILVFFSKNKINVLSSEILKRNAEIDFVVEIPSIMGDLQYYCKAKNKKRISDSDLSNAYVKGQLRKLPVILLSSGELSAKAQEMLDKELKITFKKL